MLNHFPVVYRATEQSESVPYMFNVVLKTAEWYESLLHTIRRVIRRLGGNCLRPVILDIIVAHRRRRHQRSSAFASEHGRVSVESECRRQRECAHCAVATQL